MNARIHDVATATLLFALACQPAPSADAPATSGPEAQTGAVVAEIDGVPITEAELDDWIKEELFAQQTRNSESKLYDLRSGALDRLISQRTLEIAAQNQNLDEEAVIDAAVAELGPISDDQVQAFYDQNSEKMGGASLEEISDQIRAFLEQQRQGEASTAIREKANVVVHLVAPLYDISADGPGRGPADARITIIEFSDFQCPYCRRADGVVKEVMKRYPDDVRVVYRHLPLENIHSRARPAAEASACAADQDQFWAYHDKLFENQRKLEDADLERYAEEVGLDKAVFETCVAERTHREKVDVDTAAAQGAGVTGTPAFFVNGRLLTGARPAEDFFKIIEAELGSAGDDDATPSAS